MLKKILFFYILCLSSASASSAIQLFPYNFESRYERDENQQIVDRKPFSFSLAYVHYRSKFLFDYSSFTEKTGNSVSGIKREHQEYVLWYQYSWFERRNNYASSGLYNGLGVGAYEDNVQTTFSGTTRADRSGYKLVGALSMGAKAAYEFNSKYALVGAIEGRMFMATDFDPNPNFGVILRLGLNIQI